MSADARRSTRPHNAAGEGIAAPEPGLTPAELIARATALRERLRAEQDASEARGCHSPELQEAFVAAGFYRALQPRRFGGYEFDYPTFYKAMLEISRGDPARGPDRARSRGLRPGGGRGRSERSVRRGQPRRPRAQRGPARE